MRARRCRRIARRCPSSRMKVTVLPPTLQRRLPRAPCRRLRSTAVPGSRRSVTAVRPSTTLRPPPEFIPSPDPYRTRSDPDPAPNPFRRPFPFDADSVAYPYPAHTAPPIRSLLPPARGHEPDRPAAVVPRRGRRRGNSGLLVKAPTRTSATWAPNIGKPAAVACERRDDAGGRRPQHRRRVRGQTATPPRGPFFLAASVGEAASRPPFSSRGPDSVPLVATARRGPWCQSRWTGGQYFRIATTAGRRTTRHSVFLLDQVGDELDVAAA